MDVRNPGIEIGGPLAKSRLRVMGARHTWLKYVDTIKRAKSKRDKKLIETPKKI